MVISLGLFFLFSLLIFRFFQLQIIEGEKWEQIAKRQHFFTVEVPFMRGTFWSNTDLGRAHPDTPQRLVFDIEMFHLHIDPISIQKKFHQEIEEYLLSHFNLEGSKLHSEFEKKSRSRRLVTWIEAEKKDEVLRWWQGFSRKNRIPRNALFFVSEYRRSYPFGKLLGQVLHTVQSHRDEVTKQAYPTGGLELFFHQQITGVQGKRLLKRSPRHSFETGNVIMPPKNGIDIHLTINHYLQAIAEEELEKGVKQCKAKGGWAVMMDPRTGAILALAQYPFFHPMKYQEYFNDPKKMESTRAKAIVDSYEPGSVMKPITIAIALLANQELQSRGEKPLFDPEEKTPSSDGRFPGRQKEITDVSKSNYLNLNMAIQKSSNIYVARLAQRIVERLGDAWYRLVLEEVFGFGKKTGIEYPTESSGLIPTPGKFHANGKPEWSTPTPFSLAMGHNLQVNSIQLLRAYSILANNGEIPTPTLVRQGIKASPVVLDPEIAMRVVKAMKYVTKPGGSGQRADIWGYTEAGKSGTAHKVVDGKYSETEFLSTFIGFTPVKNPAFVLLVTMDEPEKRYIPGVGYNHRGSIASAPVFKEMARRSLEYLGIASDDPKGFPVGDPRHDRDHADWIPETRSLREQYDAWNNS